MSQHTLFNRRAVAPRRSGLGREWPPYAHFRAYRGQCRSYAGNKRIYEISARTQTGAALITSLIFLTVLTILGMSTLGTALLESRMAGNARDRNLAFQAAEIGLRDAELFIRDSGRLSKDGHYSLQLLDHDNDAYLDLNETVQACTYGVCNNGLLWVTPGKDWITNPVWENNAFWANAIQYQRDVATAGKPVGRTAGGIQLAFNAAYVLPTAGLPLVSRQPEYLIEAFSKKDNINYYRITVRGYGMRVGTRVMLQEIYTP